VVHPGALRQAYRLGCGVRLGQSRLGCARAACDCDVTCRRRGLLVVALAAACGWWPGTVMPACGWWPGTVMPACGWWPGTVMPACGWWPGTVMPACGWWPGMANRVAVLVNKCSARAHCLSENRTRRASARHSAVKTAEGACERSEVLTARQCRALQSHAVFRRNAPQGRPISPVRANWLQTRELSRAQRESERVWRVKV